MIAAQLKAMGQRLALSVTRITNGDFVPDCGKTFTRRRIHRKLMSLLRAALCWMHVWAPLFFFTPRIDDADGAGCSLFHIGANVASDLDFCRLR